MLVGSGSAVVDVTDAVLGTPDGDVPGGTDITMVTVSVAPLVIVPIGQVTVPADWLHEPTVGVAET